MALHRRVIKDVKRSFDKQVEAAILGCGPWEQAAGSDLVVPASAVEQSAHTHYLTAAAEQGPPLTLEELKKTYERVRAITEFKLGDATLNLADYDVREWGGWVVMMRRRLFEPFREYDFIVYVPAERKAYVMKPREEPPLEVRPYLEGDRFARAWAFPFGFMPISQPDKTLLVYGMDFGAGEERAELKWPELICLTDAEFFDVFDLIEVPS